MRDLLHCGVNGHRLNANSSTLSGGKGQQWLAGCVNLAAFQSFLNRRLLHLNGKRVKKHLKCWAQECTIHSFRGASLTNVGGHKQPPVVKQTGEVGLLSLPRRLSAIDSPVRRAVPRRLTLTRWVIHVNRKRPSRRFGVEKPVCWTTNG